MNRLVFDIETKNTFDEAGSSDPAALDISIVGIYDEATDTYETYLEEEFHNMWKYFEKADILIGYNSNHFDIPILNKYYRGDLSKIKSIDLMAEIKKSLGRRIGLQAIAEATLGQGKSGHGLDAIYWWKTGEIDKIRKYCIEDVKVTKKLFDYIVENKKVKYREGMDIKEISIDISGWDQPKDNGMTWSLPF
jgi:uncharacterized protein YprB with RNaseH-like and TPR domain